MSFRLLLVWMAIFSLSGLHGEVRFEGLDDTKEQELRKRDRDIDRDEHDEDHEEEDWGRDDDDDEEHDEDHEEEGEEREHDEEKHAERAIEELESFAKKHAPGLLEYVEKLEKRHPEQIQEMIHHKAMEFMEVKHHLKDKKLLEMLVKMWTMELKLHDLKFRYHHAEGRGEKKEIKQALEKVLTIIFDIKLEKRRMEIRRLERELKELHEGMEKAEKRKGALIEKKMDDILSTHQDPFDW